MIRTKNLQISHEILQKSEKNARHSIKFHILYVNLICNMNVKSQIDFSLCTHIYYYATQMLSAIVKKEAAAFM